MVVMDWIALDDEADAGRELDPLVDRCRCAERDERIVTLVVVLRQLTTPGHGDLRLVGIWLCSGSQMNSKSRSSASIARSGGCME